MVSITHKATVVATVWDFKKTIYEHWLDRLAKVHADISTRARGAKSIINFSILFPQGQLSAAFVDKLALLIQEIIKLSTIFIIGSRNNKGSPSGFPVLFRNPNDRNYIPELIIISYAPGFFLRLATSGPTNSRDPGYQTASGTSYASATVASLAAYFSGLDSTLTTAAMVKERIVDLAYHRQPHPNYPDVPYDKYADNVVWKGQKGADPIGGSKAKRQSSCGSCPVAFPSQPSPLTFRTGPPQPTCAGAGCGSSCAGFFCPGTPLKQNPDFLDPRNQDSVQNPDSPYYKDWDGTITRTTTTTPTKTIPTTTPTPPKTSSVPIGGPCRLTDECEDNCPKPGAVHCESGACTCWPPPPKTTPPYAAMCDNVPMCLEAYDCGPGAFMVCEPTDYSNGNGLCQCIKGIPVEIGNAVWHGAECGVHEMYLIVPSS
ncbi:uncharacterized protein Aud_002319 [Aspergillus udagawae]|uniref:Peptidase S8/S53 domain-containing protein n=1 Tax=Aspergillus udagawae TaxID=91492 RepID=A0A8E0UY05_9EURO|nr:uncharacterized protein Aud_002319 [Aspergillus udagawae]GIC85960.1 hypothetical protein Aud_002319 [Aspergillus udagawae]